MAKFNTQYDTIAKVDAGANQGVAENASGNGLFNPNMTNNCVFNNGEECVEAEGGQSGGRSKQRGRSVLKQDRSLGERPVIQVQGESISKILIPDQGFSKSKLLIEHVVHSEAIITPYFGGHSISKIQVPQYGYSESKMLYDGKGESHHSVSATGIVAAETIKTNKLLKVESIMRVMNMIDGIYDEELRAFTHSSVVVGNVSHDSETLKMRVHLNGILYEYDDVPARVFSAFEGSASKGAFFARNIRDQYNFRKIG